MELLIIFCMGQVSKLQVLVLVSIEQGKPF